MKNGGNFWKSTDTWNFQEIADNRVLLKNVTKEKILGIKEEEKDVYQDLVQNDDKQIWIKGEENSKGYFTLTNLSSNMILTATSCYGLIMVAIDGKSNVERIVFTQLSKYLLDVLWGQLIKLIQVASNSELRENQWNDLLFVEIVPSHCFGASEASKIDCLKN